MTPLANFNMKFVGTLDTNTTWYDIMVPRNADDRYTEMEEADWNNHKNELYTATKGSLLGLIQWVEHISRLRAAKGNAPVVSHYTADFRLWLDMVTEPEKYGDDIVHFTELDASLSKAACRWRMHAEWLRQDDERIAKEQDCKVVESAVKIQALFRGHRERIHIGERFNCGICLKHQPCFNLNNGKWMCDDCFEWQPCNYCGCDVHADNRDEYRTGFWCSQDCANETH